MKALILFIWKHSYFFLFLLLEGVAAFLIVSNNNYQRSTFINASNGFTASILSASNNFYHYVGLIETNKQLAEENAKLKTLLSSFLNQKSGRIFSINDRIKNQQYLYQEAEIISNSFQKRNNYIILNKGKTFGIKPSMGVITSQGVVGIVKDVSENYCSVISILHSKSAIDVKITTSGYTGTLVWSGIDYLQGSVDNIPAHVQINIGDTIATSGNSSIFPDNIMVGTISDYTLKEGASFYKINLNFSVNYNKVKYVYIIDNTLKNELINLKNKSADE